MAKAKQITLVLVKSANYNHILMTVSAYKEICLQMSTGDYATHKAVKFKPSVSDYKCFKEFEPVYTIIWGKMQQLAYFKDYVNKNAEVKAVKTKAIVYNLADYKRKKPTAKAKCPWLFNKTNVVQFKKPA